MYYVQGLLVAIFYCFLNGEVSGHVSSGAILHSRVCDDTQ